MTDRAMRVLGMMSGTSADGIDTALVHISGAPPGLSAQLEGHFHVPFPPYLRERILRLANGAATTTAEISELNFLLGEELGRAAIAACKKWRVPLREVSLIGSHGQTVFHMGATAHVSGKGAAGRPRCSSGISASSPSERGFRRSEIFVRRTWRPADRERR